MCYGSVLIQSTSSTDQMSCPNGTHPLPSPKRVHGVMAGATNSVEGFLAEFLTPISPNIVGEPMREAASQTQQRECGLSRVEFWIRTPWSPRRAMRFPCCTIQMITHQRWESPKNKGLGPKCYDNTKRSFVATLPLMGDKETNFHCSGKSLPLINNVLVKRSCTGEVPGDVIESPQCLRVDRQNLPRGKIREEYGGIRPLITLHPSHRTTEIFSVVRKIREADGQICHNGIKTDNPYSKNYNIQWKCTRMATTIYQHEYLVNFQEFFSPIPPRATEGGNHSRKRVIHRSGEKYLWCTTAAPHQKIILRQ